MDIRMFMKLVSDDYRDKVGNSSEQQVCKECFLILSFTPSKTEAHQS
ncbi:MAG: hypothetical protein K2P87_06100 [Lachnospiraceae bacterium]|nr:hypothetical protein [Lachnospiraceae bacterium]